MSDSGALCWYVLVTAPSIQPGRKFITGWLNETGRRRKRGSGKTVSKNITGEFRSEEGTVLLKMT